MDIPKRQIQANYFEFWRSIKKNPIVKNWQRDSDAWVAFKQEHTREWLDSAIAKLQQQHPQATAAASGAAQQAASSSTLQPSTTEPTQLQSLVATPLAIPTSAADSTAPTPSADGQITTVPTLLQPLWSDSDLQPLNTWFQRHTPAPHSMTDHAQMVASLRSKNTHELQEVDVEALQKLDHEAFQYKCQQELLEMKEKKALLDLWSTGKASKTVFHTPQRSPSESKLREITQQVVAWRDGMKAYEDAAADFMASLGGQPPSRCLQGNVIFQGRVRFLSLLTNLYDQLK
eukprot:5049603-Karenia_brevis.AAC.1